MGRSLASPTHCALHSRGTAMELVVVRRWVVVRGTMPRMSIVHKVSTYLVVAPDPLISIHPRPPDVRRTV
eukprot:48503-Eustigmatos_ZCMA.PRE.1